MTNFLPVADYSRPVRPLIEGPRRSGMVHSVFRRAANIAVDDTMLTLLSHALARMPNGVRLPAGVAEEIFPLLKPGMKVEIGADKLHIPACGCSLCLYETPAWEPRPVIEERDWCRETVAQHSYLLAHYLAARPDREGFAPLVGPLLLGQPAPEAPLARRALPRLLTLARASWQHDMAGVEQAARGLAGLGPGLTPSGDDALAGFAAVMALLSQHLSADNISCGQIAITIAEAARPHTTRLSGVLLAHAARGEVAESIGELLIVLARPVEESEIILHAADRLREFGETSGSDTLLGILLGLRTLEGGIEDDLYSK